MHKDKGGESYLIIIIMPCGVEGTRIFADGADFRGFFLAWRDGLVEKREGKQGLQRGRKIARPRHENRTAVEKKSEGRGIFFSRC